MAPDFKTDLERARREFRLSREQRTALLAGHYGPLRFEAKPNCQPGDRYVLSWSKASTVDDGQGNKSTQPKLPLRWIEVTQVVARKRGGFTVRFDVTDRRHTRRLPRRSPPKHSEEIARADQQRAPSQDENELAAEQSFYTSNPQSALDHLEAVPRDWTPPDATLLHRKQQQLAKDIAMRGQSIGAQVDSYLRDAKEAGIDTRDRERRIRQELERLKDESEGKAA